MSKSKAGICFDIVEKTERRGFQAPATNGEQKFEIKYLENVFSAGSGTKQLNFFGALSNN